MGRWNNLFECHFSSCMLLAKAHDNCRGRDVEVRMLPGEFELVGVTDGTDSWIAPVAADPFSVNIARILADVRAGKMPTFDAPRPRRALKLDEAPRPRKALAPIEAVVVEQVGIIRRRHVVRP